MSNSQLDDIDFDDMLNVDKSPSPKKRKTNNTTIPQMSIKDENKRRVFKTRTQVSVSQSDTDRGS